MDTNSNTVFIVIPALNESLIINKVVHSVIDAGFSNIIVIDDGSSDSTYQQATDAGAVCISHRINRGKGAATKTGIEAAKLLNANIVVTMDGDGQHDPQDISKLIDPIVQGLCDVALGTRIRQGTMPKHKIAHNQIANFLTWSLFGLWVRDSQSGFRAYSKRAITSINTTSDNYEYESEIIKEIHSLGLIYKEVPINVHYTDYSMSKQQKQGIINGAKTLYKMIWKIISF